MKQISKRKNYYIIRPFLNYTKENLMVYCQNYCLHYSIDSTNTNKRYTRNRIRRFILPVLKKENPNAQGNWLEPWISGKNKDFCKKAFAQFYKKEAGLK